jgi:hypothetical protein
MEVLLIGTTIIGGTALFIQRVLEQFSRVIRMLAALEDQNKLVHNQLETCLKALEVLQKRDVHFETRVSDIERYLQLTTHNQDNPFVIRYDGSIHARPE